MRHCRWLRWQPTVLFGLAVLVVLPVHAEEAARPTRAEESEARLKRDIFYIGGPECEGRGATTEGLKKAGDYVAAEFKKAGLKPGNPDGTYFQPFAINGSIKEGPASFVLRGPDDRAITFKDGDQFEAMGLSAAGKVDGLPLVFAGYGLTSVADPKFPQSRPDYDDYAGLDVEGKIVVVLRDIPRTTNTDQFGPMNVFRSYGALRSKIVNAEKHKAAGLLIVNDAETAKPGDDLMDFNFTAVGQNPRGMNPNEGTAKIPVLHVRRSVLESLLGGAAALSEIEKDIDRDMKPRSRELKGWKASAEVKLTRGKILQLRNVVGILEGKGPLADETIVVGAHYDHLGYGGAGGSLARVKKPTMHNGADDNGSGTTGVMELARRLAAIPNREGRRIVFMTYSGEELGLIGSRHYVENPLIPLDKTIFMLNLDMIGRLQPDKDPKRDKLLGVGIDSGKGFDKLVDEWNKTYDFDLQKNNFAFSASDHYSFYTKKVPVIFFWTGQHPDYHRPSDTPDKINVLGMRRIVDLCEEVLQHFSTVKEKPVWQEVKGASGMRPSRGPTLGFRPNLESEDGVGVEGVTEGGPAAKAGIKAGDKIVEVAGKPVKNLTTYSEVMAVQKPGETIDVVIMREKEKLSLKVKLNP